MEIKKLKPKGGRPFEDGIAAEASRKYPLLSRLFLEMENAYRSNDQLQMDEVERKFFSFAKDASYYALLELVGLIRNDETTPWWAAIDISLLKAGELIFIFDICKSVEGKNALVRARIEEADACSGFANEQDEDFNLN